MEEGRRRKGKNPDRSRRIPADFNGDAYATVSGQNSNNSVRVNNDFIDAVMADGDWDLINRTDGSVRKTIKARDLWTQIAEAAWSCADPGLQFDTTINEWHTSPAGGRIRASNPCFTSETRVATDKGLIQFKSLVKRVADGETFQVYTHDATNEQSPYETIDLTSPTQVMVTGTNKILRLGILRRTSTQVHTQPPTMDGRPRLGPRRRADLRSSDPATG